MENETSRQVVGRVYADLPSWIADDSVMMFQVLDYPYETMLPLLTICLIGFAAAERTDTVCCAGSADC
jgi:hypothetical protein